MNLVDELHTIAAVLHREGISYAICGGVAVTIHGVPRTTKDIDLLVRRSDVPRILDAIRPLGFLDDRITVELPEGPLHVVSRATLLRMKRMAARAQDLADIEKLQEEGGA